MFTEKGASTIFHPRKELVDIVAAKRMAYLEAQAYDVVMIGGSKIGWVKSR